MQAFEQITWKDEAAVKAVFSLKNPAYNPTRVIEGLNLGYNTPEQDDITRANRRYWIESNGVRSDRTSWGLQVHGSRVQHVTEPGIYPDTDALITSVPGLALATFVADCAAVMLYDQDAGVIGTAHAGWKGAAGGIVTKTLEEMKRLGSRPARTEVFISPCISLENFEVGEEVASRFPEAVIDRSRPKPHVDLKTFVKLELLEAGVIPENIHTEPGCTYEESSRFYSYRREQNRSGRMMALISLNER